MNNRAFVVGGGPSLKDFDWTRLPLEGTIAVNAAVFNISNPEYFITMDFTFLRKVQNSLDAFKKSPCTKFFVAGLHNNHLMEWRGTYRDKRYPRLVYDLRLFDVVVKSHKADGCGFKWSDFRSGNNSGFSALQLAVLLGYTEIYLLGIDLNTTNGTHYHTMYTTGRARFQNLLKSYFVNFKKGIEAIRDYGGIDVFSCSPISSLNDFIDYVPVEDVL